MSDKIIDFEVQTAVEPWEDIWYETTDSGGRYWQRTGDRYVSRSERQIVRFLKSHKMRSTLTPEQLSAGDAISEVETAILKIETDHIVDLAGAFAGWHIGQRMISGSSVLVTQSLKLVSPVLSLEGVQGLDEPLQGGGHCVGWPMLGQYLNSRFGTARPEAADQMTLWAAMLKRSYLAISAGMPERCQALALASEVGSGKSLLFWIMQTILGGRAYKPLRYLMGRSEFNKNMMFAPLLLVDDEAADTNIANRKRLSANLKQVVATDSLSCHGKGTDEYDIKTQRWLCFALNLEDDNLLVLPPMDEDVEDKIHLFRFYKGPWPWPRQHTEAEIQAILNAEIPYFLHWLLEEFEVPNRLLEEQLRFGVLAFHHPEVLEGLDFLSPEARLLNWIDRTVLDPQKNTTGIWTGTAGQLEAEFRAVDSALSATEKDKVPAANPTLGKQLQKLARKPQHAGRLVQDREGGTGQRIWRLVSQEVAEQQRLAEINQEEVDL